MLLFFFMVVTVIRQRAVHVSIDLPEAEWQQKLKRKDNIQRIYVGHSLREPGAIQIQLNDAFIALGDLEQALKLANPDPAFTPSRTVLEADQNIRMAVINTIKEALRKNDYRKLDYKVRKSSVPLI